MDEGSWGWGAEKILYDGWRPFYDHHLRPFYETSGLGVWELFSYYFLAAWFWLVEPSRWSLFSFSNLFSLLGAMLAYWVFRQWTNARTAWVGLFFMVTLRWYLNFSRCAHPAYDVPFYLCGTLAFWLYSHKTDRLWAWIACAIFLSAGFYAYPALLVMPLLVALWAFYEWKKQVSNRPKLFRRYLLGFAMTLLFSAPIWVGMILRHSLGAREEQDWFFSKAQSDAGIAFLRHFFHFALMFDRQGDWWPIHNWPNYRMLDPVTGFLFFIGLIYAIRNWKEQPFFYCLCGIFVMALPGLLTASDAPVSHVIGMIPFIVYLAAQSFTRLWDSLDLKTAFSRKTYFGIAFLLLAGMGWSNFYDYFYRQERDPVVCTAFYPDATAVGERVQQGGESEVVLVPKFFGNFIVNFLAYKKAANFQLLNTWTLSWGGSGKVEKTLLFVLDEGKTGLLPLLQKTYPGGSTEIYEYFKGWPLVYFYRVPAGSPHWKGTVGGIQGVYWASGDWSGPPVLARADPILNFTFRSDFGLADFKTLSARWTGFVAVPESGSYSFLTLTTDQSAVRVDGRKVMEGHGTQEGVVFLKPGRHPIQVDFQKNSGVDTAFNLLWKMPGSQNYRIVPFWQWSQPFRRPHPRASNT